MRSAVVVMFVAAGICAMPQTPAQRRLGRQAASLYIGQYGREDTIRPFLAVRSEATVLFKSMTPAKLAATLEPVYAAFKPDAIEALGAAYVMARHGAGITKNVDRMVRAYELLSKRENGGIGNGLYILEAFPEALAEIAIKQTSHYALGAMYRVPMDGAVAESASGEQIRIWAQRPRVWKQFTASGKEYEHMVQVLALGYINTDEESNSVGRGAVLEGFATFKRTSSPAEKVWADKLLKDVIAASKKFG